MLSNLVYSLTIFFFVNSVRLVVMSSLSHFISIIGVTGSFLVNLTKSLSFLNLKTFSSFPCDFFFDPFDPLVTW